MILHLLLDTPESWRTHSPNSGLWSNNLEGLPTKEKQMSDSRNTATGFGVSLGSAMAMILSFAKNHSILYMIIHGLFSWLYVIYRILKGY
jgi:hypothetical protein